MAPMPSTNPLSLKKRALESDSSVENSSPFKKQRPLSDDNTLLRSYQNSTHEGSEQESSSDSSSDSDTMRTEPITLAERPRRRTSSEEDVVTDSGSDSGEESESSESSTSSSSSSSSSSEEDEDDAMSETEDNDQEDLPDAIPRIPALQKPQIQRPMDSDLRSRLTTFLPTLKAANEDLEGNIAAGKGGDIVMDNADEGKESQYIEMVCRLLTSSQLMQFIEYIIANVFNWIGSRSRSPRRESLRRFRQQ